MAPSSAARERAPCGSGAAEDLRLDGLVLGIRDELRLEHLARLVESLDRLTRRAAQPGRGGISHDLNATRPRPQLLDLAESALLAPGLILRLADAIDRLRQIRAQSRVDEGPVRGLRTDHVARAL